MSDSIIQGALDDYSSLSTFGSMSTAIGNNLYGINHRQTPTAVPINKDSYGLTFFVRPQLNLTSDNIRNKRIFTTLLNTNSESLQRIIRCLLDPRLMLGFNSSGSSFPSPGNALPCKFVDNDQAFIPILTNHIKSLSGWPDLSLNSHTSKEGAAHEAHTMVDDILDNYTQFDLEATFRNSRGDPIMLLFYVWEHYMASVFEGSLIPYPDFLVENEIDYMTRIYRLVLDQDKKRVVKIGACGVAYPTSLPIGGYFDFSTEKPYNDFNQDITIRFRCLGAQYNDDILIDEFNRTVLLFNPFMAEDTISTMVKIPDSLLPIFNNRGYPRIDPNTYALEWYVPADLYNTKVLALRTLGSPLAEFS